MNGELHRVLKIDRPNDLITLWAYPSARRVSYTYSTVKRQMQKAWTTTEVCKLLGRNYMTINRALKAGEIETPQFTYGLNEERKMFQYMWREEDIMALHAALAEHPAGRIAKDGSYSRQNLPSARELRAMIRNNIILYVKTDEGFVPTWEAEQF